MDEDPAPGRDAKVLELLAAYGSAMRRLARVYAREPADQDDLVQEIAIAVWQAWPRFRGDASERTWIYRIAHNVASTFRSTRRRQQNDAPLEDVAALGDRGREERLDLVGLVRALPPVDRQIVALYLEGLTGAEIAAVTGLSPSNVGVRLSRARKTLQAAARGTPS